jgi:hypothetical protein
MAEVTYYVALPFVAADDGIALTSPRNTGRTSGILSK